MPRARNCARFFYGQKMSVPSYKKLYSTKQWYRLRHYQLKQSPLCIFCQKLGRIQAAQIVDHIEPHRGDKQKFFDANNLQSLCKLCHDGAKQQLEKSGALRGCDINGIPFDSGHHWQRNTH